MAKLRGLLALSLSLGVWPASPAADPTSEFIQAHHIADHINRLASDEFEGRAPGTRGETLTINYLAAQFKSFGLAPGNPDGTYFQKVPMVGYLSRPRIEVEAGGHKSELQFLEDFVHDAVALRRSASVKGAGIVFAGYGIVAPEYSWDDYQGIDVRNRLVIVLSGEPTADPALFNGARRTYHSTREAKFELAAARGAAGILVVTDPAKSGAFSIFKTFAEMEGCSIDSNESGRTLITGLITVDAARRLIQQAGADFDRLEAEAARPNARAVQLNARADIAIRSRIRRFDSHNVVARIEGSDPRLRDETVVYSAHWDHLGRNPNLQGDQIYNGAIDDAAGTAQMLEIARAFAAPTAKPRRSVLFIATTAEEKGYLGSHYYVQHPLYPLATTVANFNLDGGNVWGMTTDVITTGYGLSTLDETLAQAARMQNRKFLEEAIDDGGLYFSSDQIEFAKAGVPATFPFSGFQYVGKPEGFGDQQWSAYSEHDYHQVSDEVKADWDLSGAAEDASWLMIAGKLVADAEEKPQWKAGSEFRRR